MSVIFLMLKKSANRRQREQLEAAFEKADTNGDGLLSADDYHRILSEHGVDCSMEEILHIMQWSDRDGDGFVSREEFVQGHRQWRRRRSSTDIAFNAMDSNHDGLISKRDMMNKMTQLTKSQVDLLFDRMDEDRDGKMTRAEFGEMMDNHGAGSGSGGGGLGRNRRRGGSQRVGKEARRMAAAAEGEKGEDSPFESRQRRWQSHHGTPKRDG